MIDSQIIPWYVKLLVLYSIYNLNQYLRRCAMLKKGCEGGHSNIRVCHRGNAGEGERQGQSAYVMKCGGCGGKLEIVYGESDYKIRGVHIASKQLYRIFLPVFVRAWAMKPIHSPAVRIIRNLQIEKNVVFIISSKVKTEEVANKLVLLLRGYDIAIPKAESAFLARVLINWNNELWKNKFHPTSRVKRTAEMRHAKKA